MMLIDYVVHGFVKGGAVQKGSRPGFAHALQLSYGQFEGKRTSIPDRNTMTYRYPLLANNKVNKVTAGLLTAIMDELTTVACFAVGQPSAPGVSLQMSTEVLVHHDNEVEEIDVINIVTKLGRTVSNTRTEFRHPDTAQLLAYASHVKYMPTGSWILDAILSNKFLYSIYQWLVVDSVKEMPLYDESKDLQEQVIGESLEPVNAGYAKFHVTGEHTNPFGGLHGGCHAIVMEQVGTTFAYQELKPQSTSKHGRVVVLQALSIDFLRPAKRGWTVDVTCERIGGSEEPAAQGKEELHVRVFVRHKDKICSEGKLRFVVIDKYY